MTVAPIKLNIKKFFFCLMTLNSGFTAQPNQNYFVQPPQFREKNYTSLITAITGYLDSNFLK